MRRDRSALLEEIEFEVRQWYAGNYDARACAERILILFDEAPKEAREPATHCD